jgi:hypothetical protein
MSREALYLLQEGEKIYCFACSQYAPVLVKVGWRQGRSLEVKVSDGVGLMQYEAHENDVI